jgi:imidazolonepropionase-like amidohydrolase
MTQRILIASLVLGLAVTAAFGEGRDDDLAQARAVFEANLAAIERQDRDAYLACYLQSDHLARTGPEGPQLGFDDHAAGTEDDTWPDVFESLDLQLVPVSPGVVYGTYRYRVSYAGDEYSGISERIFLETDDGWKIAMTSAFEAPPGTPPPPRALVGGTLIDGTGAEPVPDAAIVIRGGRIECAGSREGCPVPDGVETLDVSGKWITPGLVDAHVHFSQTGWADGRPDSLDLRDRHPYHEVQAELRENPERFLRSYLCSGVTAVFDVGGYPWTWELSGRFEGSTLAPHVAASGPLLSTLDFWLNLPAERQFIFLEDEASGRRDVHYHAAHGADAVKVWFINTPDRDFDEMAAAVVAAGDEAERLGLPLIVHATGLVEAKAALRAGADLLVHSVWDKPVDDEFIELARANETIYCPTLTVIEGYGRMYDAVLTGNPPMVDDPNGCVDPETLAHVASTAELDKGLVDAEQQEKQKQGTAARIATMNENLARLHEAGIPVAMGTDAGNPLTLHGPAVYAEMDAMQAAGMSPSDVLVASTRQAALAMGRLEAIGTIEAGKIADLLVVEADPTEDVANFRQLQYVIRGGVVRTVEELKPLGR